MYSSNPHSVKKWAGYVPLLLWLQRPCILSCSLYEFWFTMKMAESIFLVFNQFIVGCGTGQELFADTFSTGVLSATW